MWTNVSVPSGNRYWTPNHFVPLLRSELPATIVISTDQPKPRDQIPVLSLSLAEDDPVFTYARQEVSDCTSSDLEQVNPYSQLNVPVSPDSPTERGDRVSTYGRQEVSDCAPSDVQKLNPHDQLPLLPHSPIERDGQFFTYGCPDASDCVSSDLDKDMPQASTPVSQKRRLGDTQSDPEGKVIGTPLPTKGKFMAIEQILQVVKNDGGVLNSVPFGKKDNVYFIVDDSSNAQKRKNKQKSDFPDDCGVWDRTKSYSVNSYVIVDGNGKAKTVYRKENAYCTEIRIQGKSTYVPLVPQPDEDEVMTLHRYYASLKAEANYKKRVTCINGVGFTDVAVIKYSGQRLTPRPAHGNAKRHKTEYVRTDPKVMTKIAEAVRVKQPREVYQDLLEKSSEAPRDFKQVRDKKFNEEKKARHQYRSNVADDVLSVLSLLNENCHVQEIIHKKNKPPCVVLYSDEQMLDMKRNLVNGSVLGIDRTFNLGSCYVTTTVYKNCSVVRKESDDHQLFLGPVYLHWDGDFFAYHSFFSHLQAMLYDCISEIELRLGSDQESALMKAAKSCFPNATHLLCTKHLKDNVNRYLTDKVGCPTKVRVQVVEAIFGDNGLVKSLDIFSFENKALNVLDIARDFPLFGKYFEKLNI